jgi:hypothetical protein
VCKERGDVESFWWKERAANRATARGQVERGARKPAVDLTAQGASGMSGVSRAKASSLVQDNVFGDGYLEYNEI